MVRSAARLGASTLALVALAACAAGPIATAPAATPAVAATAPLGVNSDQDFLDRAATGTGAEVELGRLARQRGVAPAVRTFGATIAAEHSQAHARLVGLARRLGMNPNATTPDLSRLTALSGANFDREFMVDQVNNQREALGLFEGEAQTGRDPQLRRFARDRVPLLQRDLRRAEDIAARLGG
jgi:putative membrane protein